MLRIINIIGEKVKSKLAKERYGLKITLGQNTNTGNLIRYEVENEEYWDMVDGFVRSLDPGKQSRRTKKSKVNLSMRLN